MREIKAEVLVVGAGGAGISPAAAAATNGAAVTIVDDNPALGGQIWRKGIEQRGSKQAEKIIEELDRNDVRFSPSTTIVDRVNKESLQANGPEGPITLSFGRLVITTGARERFVPFPGWTLPNVYGVGGLQSLAKGGLEVAGKRIIIAGSGPLMLAVADYLVSHGAIVPIIAEQAPRRDVLKFGVGLVRVPFKVIQAAGIRFRTRKTKIFYDSHVVEAIGESKVESVRIESGGKINGYECDMLATGFHLIPNLELPALLGCEHSKDGVFVNDHQQTSVENIFAAGETTGIGGIELACVEGQIAGYAATGDTNSAKLLFRKRKRLRTFAERLNKAYVLRPNVRNAVRDSTIVCRCEDVSYGDLKNFENWRKAKLQTRCGMGPCQGRICGPATNYLFGWETGGVRPPIFPVKLKNLGEKK